ncbi:polypeptide N-acetylgalactosaminyltransferase 17 [Halichoeres trimaculatus]|uniref:polypeptide N-acetylgalactosaminyltransferase 17 n=1 Tax=Halichoeres trimaculatus TaxID=147232 RepID=UPI003D9E4CCC
MAFLLRRWRVSLVLNVIALAGFITFWARCNMHQATVREAPAEERRPEVSGVVQGPNISHEMLLKRLSFLEDVVYRQLNGLSKSLGLIEGFGGRGEGGQPATLTPDEESTGKILTEKYGYNAYLSDKISLDRTTPDFRPNSCSKIKYPRDLPQISLIFIFVNEALSVLLRSVHSAVNHTPAHLLKEIILVDDMSDDEQLKGPLEEYVNKRYPGLVKIIRNQKRMGLIQARIEGWKVATGEVTGFFDAHVEFTVFWAEPALARIKENHRRVVLPSIDNINYDTLEVEYYGQKGHAYNWELWCMYIPPSKQWLDTGDESAPIRSPAMIGCSFVINREYFGELGLLDTGMEVWGGENIELGIKVWLCGGSMEVLPCSRVYHMSRRKKPYVQDLTSKMRRNALRVAEVWLDEYKSNVYQAWNIPMEDHGIDYGDISERVALKKSLKCKKFGWYLDNVYPEMRRYINTLFYGQIRSTNVNHLCIDQGEKADYTAIVHPCHEWVPQLGRYTKEGQLFIGALGSTGDDTPCVLDDGKSPYPRLLSCEEVPNQEKTMWNFHQNGSLVNRASGRCLEVIPAANSRFGYRLVLQPCSGQKWTFKNTIKKQ